MILNSTPMCNLKKTRKNAKKREKKTLQIACCGGDWWNRSFQGFCGMKHFFSHSIDHTQNNVADFGRHEIPPICKASNHE
jgi:hypothetical protein